MNRFIFLRDKTGNWQRSNDALNKRIAPVDPQGPAQPVIEAAALSEQDLADAFHDTTILSMAPVMATRLVAPYDMDLARQQTPKVGWGLDAVGATQTRYSGKGSRVALLDTGIDSAHPAFQGVTITSQDFVGTGVQDVNGHGTHLAGTVLGRDLENQRIGVARGITDLYVGKAVLDTGKGSSCTFLKAFLWALQQKPDIIGFAISFDTLAESEALQDNGYPANLSISAAVHAYRGNLRIFERIIRMSEFGPVPLILGAAGDDCLRYISPEFTTGPVSPAAGRGVLAVGACQQGANGIEPAPFSNNNPALVAPGTGIISADLPTGTRALNGSCMAMAHAAGVAALWAEKLREEGETPNASTLANCLSSAAISDGMGPSQTPISCGRGLVQAP
ncbi:MAG: S8 family serine peptidase [Pelagimonas sp.]|jgi:hypothetical protein|nr:S8 family serine peptidase [Pelagimonas sp.]